MWPASVPVEGASVIALRRDAVLMVERRTGPFAGLWSFPGGKIELDEDAEGAARRELLEETGLAVGALVRLGAFRPAPANPHLSITVFAGRAGPGEPIAGDDAGQARFVPFERVLSLPHTPGAAGWIARGLQALARANAPADPGAKPSAAP